MQTPTPPPSVVSVQANVGSQGKNWCFTLNHYTDANEQTLVLLAWDICVKYIIYGREVGESGTPHLQGFIQFRTNKRFNAVKALLPAGCHLEKARGTAYEASEYCKKEDCDFYEHGEVPAEQYTASGNATKHKWEEAMTAAKNGDLESISAELMIRYYSTFLRIKKDYMVTPEPLDAPCGLWIFGATGTGKSHSVVTQHPDRYIKPLNKWWDGYQGQDVVHLDELDPGHSGWIAAYLKKWADKWPFDAEVKGGAMQIRPKLLVITSNYRPSEMGFRIEDLPALVRRFRMVEKFRDQNLIVQ
nr:MAG: replication associated protein [Arizlama virus]